MIVEYHRPQTLAEALDLLARPAVLSVPAGGGTALHRLGGEPVEIVDLQSLGLNHVERRGNQIVLGATLTLQELSELEYLPLALRTAARQETSFNLRQMGTLAGTLVSCDGCSPFAAVMLALDAHLTIVSASERTSASLALGELLPLRHILLKNKLITLATIPGNVKVGLEIVGRTPADWPVVGVAMAQWPSGRTRVTLMGYGSIPLLAMDGPEPDGAAEAVQFAFNMASDEWASAEYRQSIGAILVERILSQLNY